MKKFQVLLLSLLTTISFCFSQSEQLDTSAFQRIKDQATNHSGIMETAHYLTDINGPRLTNSPGFRKASQWAVNKLKSLGLQNVALEPWGNFGPGWSIKKTYVAVTEPYYHTITAYPLAWTKGTNGLVKADVMQLSALDPDLIKSLGDKVKGKIILPLQTDTVLRSNFEADAQRFSNEALQNLTDKSVLKEEEIKGMVGYLDNMKEAIRLLQQQGCIAILNMSSDNRDGTIDAGLW
ncbi:MAG: hypothetical protein WAU24_11650, partial [Chitinophagaceae bacterium]